MEQGNYGENFDRGYEEQARPRQGKRVYLPIYMIMFLENTVLCRSGRAKDLRLQGLLQEYSEYYCRYCLFWCMLLRYLLYNTGIG